MPQAVAELDDIQGLLKTGYGPLTEASNLVLWVRDPGLARAWLATFRPTTMGDLARTRVAIARHLAVSAPGLSALGLPDTVLERFSPEFVGGMAADPARSRRLGDVGANAPARWAWGQAGLEPHLLLMLFALPGGLPALLAETRTPAFEAAFEALELPTAPLDGREPFGFVDGLSQPVVDWDAERRPDTSEDLDYGNLISAGEFLLGYPNEYGLVTRSPATEDADLGRNGTYLVFRQLHQDVEGFWNFVNANGGLPLAEAMVGRKLDGEPLARTGERPIRGVGPKQSDIDFNGYDFESDVDGLRCPITGHVRRANPRTGDQPGGNLGIIRKLAGMLGLGIERRPDTIASSRYHRLLRRGRKYGAGADTGLHFICLGASIARQFEFVQGAWLDSAKFGGLSGEQDPLLGSRQPHPAGHATDAFRWPQRAGPCRTLEGLPQFVTVRGGAYFFLPGVKALRYLAAL
ncbi:MAG: peroxidase [Phenylobacterium sp.]|uniref:Dyp-type peroxidase n=1 Tax=Phenylobacterium sp. TaxID=1871053 RepID=UPI00121B9639|nr:hypothetical protein [Phenylobacterium sp.]TAJ73199.1 MAG: peroxidase [Phenylobacterium sp.]